MTKKGKLKIKDKYENIFISFIRGIKLGVKNFWRNKFLSFATIVVMATILVIFNIILGIQYIGNQALQSLSERVDIIIYLKDDISFNEAIQLTEDIKKIEGVQKVKYTSKEEALEIIAKTHPETANFLQKFEIKNPLPPSISIATKNTEDHRQIQKLLTEDRYKNLLQNYSSDELNGENIIISSVAKNLENISKFIKQVIFWVVFVFILGGTLIIVNAIQLTIFHRKQEIHIMRLVGATPNFIRTPFIIEGLIFAVCAVLLSFIILFVLANIIKLDSSNLWEYYSEINIKRVIISELIISIVLAVLSSFSVSEQYIKGKLILK